MKWDVLHSEFVLQTPWLTVRKDHVRQPSGVEMDDFYVLEYRDWVNVIAIDEKGLFVIEEQYRHGIQKVCLELCAGIVEDNESPLEAAKRELLEETGYADGEWTELGRFAPNSSAMTNYCHCFIARNVKKVHAQSTDESEDIKVRLISKQDLVTFLVEDSFVEGTMAASLWKFLSNVTDK